MIRLIIQIRAKQLLRLTSQLGLFRTIFLFLLVVFIILALISKISENSYREIITTVYITGILSIHFNRKDKDFLKINAPNPIYIFLVEYFLISIPLIAILIYNQLWIYLLVFVSFLIFISFLKLRKKNSQVNTVFQIMIPHENFEWKAGLRRNQIFFIIIWFVGLTTSYFIASVPIVIFILSVFILSFYEKCEPIEILIANELGVNRFLLKKVQNQSMIFAVLIVPLILSFVIFNPEYFYIPIIEFLFFSIILIYTILLKYAFYRPNTNSGASQIFTMMGIISIFIPVLLPLIIILSIKFLFQARKNLKFYLNDYN